MNIFILDKDPQLAAKALCNLHILKMSVETAQLLCSAHTKGTAPYKQTHVNHPCSKWTRESVQNYEWLICHGEAICSEYTKRYGKIHASERVIQWCKNNVPNLPNIGLTPFAIAITDKRWHTSDPVISYRAYYIAEKSKFAKWKPRTTAPSWWPFSEEKPI